MSTYRVERAPAVGRYTSPASPPQDGRLVVADRDLEGGETVMSELPFAVGPKTASYLLCLACYLPLHQHSPCPTCTWPICSEECAAGTSHKDWECAVFSAAMVAFQPDCDEAAQLSCIMPLRVLLAGERDGERWRAEVEGMEGHLAEREGSEEWQAEQVNVVRFLREKCGLDRFSEELVRKVCGILEVNSFEVMTPTQSAIRGLYPKSGMLNHDCVANTAHSIDPADEYRMTLRTTRGVKAGMELTCSYTSCLLPTLVRRERLKLTKYFLCRCQRCSDPTELGTHIGTLKCTKCDNGLITSSGPLDEEAAWKCSHCENTLSGATVRRVYSALQEEVDQLEYLEGPQRLEATEKVLRSYKSVLHPRNGYNVMLWHSLSQLYGHTDGYTLDMLPDLLLERKSNFCKDLLEVLEVVEPGYTRMRGLTLYEWHVGLLMCARSQYQRGEISGEALRERLREVVGLLEECLRILGLEPPSSPEAVIANIARQAVQQLQQSLQEI